MKNEIKLSDLKQHDSMYFIGDLDPHRDGDGWVFEDEALAFIHYYNDRQWERDRLKAIDTVVKTIRENEFDGETMEHILREIGMEQQMLRQLILKATIDEISELICEKMELIGKDIGLDRYVG
jgi:hypothetical protein